jgi:hypothetical protein
VRRIVLIAVATSLAVGSGAAAPSPSRGDTGLTGKVLRGPTSPVCRFDRPCYAPFKGVLVFSRASPGAAAAPVRAQSQADGDYRVELAPARYKVTTGVRSRFGGLLQPALVRVPATGMRRVNFVVDTGIR